MIYLDNAATTKMSNLSFKTMINAMNEIYGNPSSLHSLGQVAAQKLQSARKQIANCIGASADEIIFTSGGSEADNQAIISAAKFGRKNGKNHIISTTFEHHAILNVLKNLERDGFEITLLDVGENGIVTAKQVENAITKQTCLVTIMYANNEIGSIQPVKEIGEICRNHKVTFHTDAVQAAGHVHINVEKQNIDMLSISAHKFHGPKGVGALYCRKGIPLHPLIHGGAQERNKRAGTENTPAILSMAAGFENSCNRINEDSAKIIGLRNKLIDGISKIPHSILNGCKNNRLPGNVNFCFEGIEGESLLLLLDDKGICASSGSACTSGSLEPSHVLLAIGRPHEVAHGSLRLSLSNENTDEEIEYTIKAVTEVVEYLRGISPVWRDLKAGKKEFVIK